MPMLLIDFSKDFPFHASNALLLVFLGVGPTMAKNVKISQLNTIENVLATSPFPPSPFIFRSLFVVFIHMSIFFEFT